MFENQRRVILYGVSLLLEGVQANLKRYKDLDIWVLDPSRENAIEAIRALCPAVFVFDLNAVQIDFQLSLLRQPGLLLVGIDPETHQALVWSGRQEAAMDSTDLINVIHS
jgi:hypothetical protein